MRKTDTAAPTPPAPPLADDEPPPLEPDAPPPTHAAPPPALAPTPIRPGLSISREQIRGGWSPFIEGGALPTPIRTELKRSNPVAWDGKTLEVRLPRAWSLNILNNPKTIAQIEAALAQHFGLPMALRLTSGEPEGGTGAGAGSGANAGGGARRPDLLMDPVVQHARSLGFEVRQIKEPEDS